MYRLTVLLLIEHIFWYNISFPYTVIDIWFNYIIFLKNWHLSYKSEENNF